MREVQDAIVIGMRHELFDIFHLVLSRRIPAHQQILRSRQNACDFQHRCRPAMPSDVPGVLCRPCNVRSRSSNTTGSRPAVARISTVSPSLLRNENTVSPTNLRQTRSIESMETPENSRGVRHAVVSASCSPPSAPALGFANPCVTATSYSRHVIPLVQDYWAIPSSSKVRTLMLPYAVVTSIVGALLSQKCREGVGADTAKRGPTCVRVRVSTKFHIQQYLCCVCCCCNSYQSTTACRASTVVEADCTTAV